jgi:DnaJ-class molecular chaperone
MRDLYEVLGVNRKADTNEIRTAYKQLAKEHHPDKGGDPEKFKELSQAHETLSDDAKRRAYDMTGSINDQQPNGFDPTSMPFGMPPDVFSHMFGGMFPGGNPGGAPRKREGKGPGKTQEIPLRIIDYYQGRTLNVKLGRQISCKTCSGSGGSSFEDCSTCNGAGQVNQRIQMGPIQMVTQTSCPPCGGKGRKTIGKCMSCSGRGVTHEEKTLEIKVEPGMLPGNTILFSGMCSDHPGFTEAGDVTIILRESDEDTHDTSQWTRDGSRLKTTVGISLTESLLGTVKIVKGHPGYPQGLPIEIPAGVQNMWLGTYPTLGMPIRGTPKYGEANVTVIVTPTEVELSTLKENSVLLKNCFPPLGPGPEGVTVVNRGSWKA